jgi:hypothetical protein
MRFEEPGHLPPSWTTNIGCAHQTCTEASKATPVRMTRGRASAHIHAGDRVAAGIQLKALHAPAGALPARAQPSLLGLRRVLQPALQRRSDAEPGAAPISYCVPRAWRARSQGISRVCETQSRSCYMTCFLFCEPHERPRTPIRRVCMRLRDWLTHRQCARCMIAHTACSLHVSLAAQVYAKMAETCRVLRTSLAPQSDWSISCQAFSWHSHC